MRAGGAASEWQQRDVACALDRFAEPTLVARADAGHAARENFAAFLHELRQDVGALVVDEVHLLDAELADFLFAEVLALAAARSAWTAGTSAWSAFTAWTAVSTTGATMTAAWSVSATSWTAGSGGLFLFFCHNCLPFRVLLRLRCSSGAKARSLGELSSGLKPRPPEEKIQKENPSHKSKKLSQKTRNQSPKRSPPFEAQAKRSAAATLSATSLPELAPEPQVLAAEERIAGPACGVDAARHALRACARISSGASGLRRDARSDT
jgi:hypothetical protein